MESIAVTKHSMIYLHLERNWLSTQCDHRAFVCSTSPGRLSFWNLHTDIHKEHVQQAKLPPSPSKPWEVVFSDGLPPSFRAPLTLPPPLHHLRETKGSNLLMAFKLFLYQEQYIFKHYMHPRFVSMWPICFNLGLSMGKKKKSLNLWLAWKNILRPNTAVWSSLVSLYSSTCQIKVLTPKTAMLWLIPSCNEFANYSSMWFMSFLASIIFFFGGGKLLSSLSQWAFTLE